MTSHPNQTRQSVAHSTALPAHPGFTLVELLVVFLIIAVVIALLLPATRSSTPASRRSQCKNNLHQIAIALHNYADEYGSFPPAYTVDDAGRPLHSWRTLILPYVDQGPLYRSIDLSKPWDDSANAAALAATLNVYRCPSADIPQNCTTYLGLVSSTGCFAPSKGRRLSDITRDHSETLMVVEASPDAAVPWMAPQDTDGQFLLTFGRQTRLSHEDGTHAAYVDGHVGFVSSDIPIEERRAMLTIAAQERAAHATSSVAAR